MWCYLWLAAQLDELANGDSMEGMATDIRGVIKEPKVDAFTEFSALVRLSQHIKHC